MSVRLLLSFILRRKSPYSKVRSFDPSVRASEMAWHEGWTQGGAEVDGIIFSLDFCRLMSITAVANYLTSFPHLAPDAKKPVLAFAASERPA